MANSANSYPKEVPCPLVARAIDFMDCIEVQDTAERLIKAEGLPEEFKRLDNWREICKACKYHEKS